MITGDDLGLHDDWDAGIFAALRGGVVTSTSVVTNGPTYGAAVRVLRAGGFDCGVHLNLVDGAPLSSAADVPSLVDAHGRFPGSVGHFLLRYACGAVRTGEVAIEWERQVQRAIDDGLRPTHLNGHYHLHVLPRLFKIAVELARRFGIGWVRLPDEAPWHARGAVGRARVGGLLLLARRNRTAHAGDGIGLMPCRGIAANGRLGLAAWQALLDRLGRRTQPSAVEVLCHPGQVSEETAALLSRLLAEDLSRRATLRTFRELGAAPGSPRPLS